MELKLKSIEELNATLLDGAKMRPDAANEVTGYPKSMHIVYRHVDPETRDTVYVGEGKIHRAYEVCGRKYEHHQWIVDKLTNFHFEDIVVIEGGNYTKDEARKIEKILIQKYIRKGCNLFNVVHNDYRKAKRLVSEETPSARDKGLFSEHADDGQPSSSEDNQGKGD